MSTTLTTLAPRAGGRGLVLSLAVTPDRLLAVGGQRRDLFLVSVDGTTFQPIDSPGKGLRDVCADGDEIWTVGEYGHIARSLDAGQSWTVFKSKASACLFGVGWDAEGTLWVSGEQGFLARFDGKKFHRFDTSEHVASDETLARFCSSSRGLLFSTSKGRALVLNGETLQPLNCSTGEMGMTCLETQTGALLWVGLNGALFRAPDFDSAFERVSSDARGMLTSATELPSGQLLVVGERGQLFVSEDDGRSFVASRTPAGCGTLWTIKAWGQGALIGGESGQILRYGDPGALSGAASLPDNEAPRPAVPHFCAEPSPEVLPPPPPPMSREVERVGALLVGDRYQRTIFPRKGGVQVDLPPVPSTEDAWAMLRRLFWAADRAGMEAKNRRSGIWGLVTSYEARAQQLGERILDVNARTGTEDEDATLVAATLRRYNTFVGGHHGQLWDAVADFLVAQVGIAAACRRALLGMKDELPYTGVGPFARLRLRLANASDSEYQAAVDGIVSALDEVAARSKGTRDHTLRDAAWAASFLAPLSTISGRQEHDLHAEAMKGLAKFGDFGVHACGLASGDISTLKRFLDVNGRVRHEFYSGQGGRSYLASLMDFEGDAVAPILAKMKLAPPFEDSYDENSKWCALMGFYDHPATKAALEHEAAQGHQWGIDFLAFHDRLLNQSDEVEPEIFAPLTGGGKPVHYVPPPQMAPARSIPEEFALAPELKWRRPEEGPATKSTTDEPISPERKEELDQWLRHKEKWAIPTTFREVLQAPPAYRSQLLSLPLSPVDDYGPFRQLLETVGLDALPFFRDGIASSAAIEVTLDAAQPLADVAVGCSVVTAFGAKKHKAAARSWMLRHPEHAKAACRVVAQSKGTSAKDRDAAARALRYLDPSDTSLDGALKRRKPKPLPDFIDVNRLPEIEDRDALLASLSLSTADEPMPDVVLARGRPQMAHFAWTLFQMWLDAGAPNASAWCFHAVGFWGGDTEADALLPYIEQWPSQQATARVKIALDALLNIGTDRSLSHLGNLRFYAREAGTRSGAEERIHELALRNRLSSDEVEERIALDYGASQTKVIDYGERQFTVAFDDALVPIAVGPDGTRYYKLPGARKGEDKARVSAEKKVFAALVKAITPHCEPTLGRLKRLAQDSRLVPEAIWVRAYRDHPWLSSHSARLSWEQSPEGVRLLDATPGA